MSQWDFTFNPHQTLLHQHCWAQISLTTCVPPYIHDWRDYKFNFRFCKLCEKGCSAPQVLVGVSSIYMVVWTIKYLTVSSDLMVSCMQTKIWSIESMKWGRLLHPLLWKLNAWVDMVWNSGSGSFDVCNSLSSFFFFLSQGCPTV